MPEIPFDVSQYYIPAEDRLVAQEDKKNLDDIQGMKNRSQSANWYQRLYERRRKQQRSKQTRL